MSNTDTTGLTDSEISALTELNDQLSSASEDDPLFNVDEVVRKPQTAEDAGTLVNKAADPEADAAAKAAAEAAAATEATKTEPQKTAEELAAEQAAAAAAQETQPPAPETKLNQPLLVVDVPEGTTERLTAIADEKKAVVAQFDDGDLTASEMSEKLEALNKEERGLERIIDRAETAQQLENQRVANERTTEINTFLAQVNIPNDPANLRFQTLNQAVIQVASDPANAALGATAILQKAHDLCVTEGVLPAKTTTTTPPKQELVPPKALNAPPTLGGLPAADVSTTEENRFAHLNRMHPDAREAAFAKMSQADQDAYLAAGA